MRASPPATLATPETKHICAVSVLLSASPEPEQGLLCLSKPAPFLEQCVSLSSLCIALKPGCVLHGSSILGRAGSWCRVGRGTRGNCLC